MSPPRLDVAATGGSRAVAEPAASQTGAGGPRRWQNPPLIALAAGSALLLIGIGLAVANEHAYQAQNTFQVRAEGRFLAALLTPALQAHDRAAANRNLQALQADPETVAAAVYDAGGRLFAGYTRTGAALPVPGAAAGYNRLVVATPIADDGSRLGNLLIEAETDPTGSRLRRYVGLGLLATMASLLVFVLVSAHAALTRANEDLERRAQDLAAANRQLRAQIVERERAEMALRQSQKMEAIGRLTGGVAHDFNNLITVVAGNLELIERLADTPDDRGVAPDRLLRLVAAAQSGLRRGERLARQLLALSRQQPLETRIVDINAAIREFAPLAQRAIGEAIELRLRLGTGRWLCKLDPAQFEAALLNLAINARDATTGGGWLTIASDLAPADPADHATGGVVGQQVVITVSDTGSGMPPEVLSRLFEPFYTTKPVGRGSGLGLAQVWGFVKQSGGRIAVDSQPGLGTAFRLYFPLTEQPCDIVEATAAITEPGGSERILVVEDEENVRAVAAATLTRLGYRTAVAPDGIAALALLETDGEFDLLFADYVMPNGLNGAELARQACHRRPRLRVLLTSGYSGQIAPIGRDRSLEGFPMLAKPYRSAELAARIREVLDTAPVAPAG